jgi:hypothetical protein
MNVPLSVRLDKGTESLLKETASAVSGFGAAL